MYFALYFSLTFVKGRWCLFTFPEQTRSKVDPACLHWNQTHTLPMRLDWTQGKPLPHGGIQSSRCSKPISIGAILGVSFLRSRKKKTSQVNLREPTPSYMFLDYLARYFTGKAESMNQRVIQQRILALQAFLDFIQAHSVLSQDQTFLRFISDEPNWMEVHDVQPIMSPPLSSHLDKPLTKKITVLQQSLEALEKSESKHLRGHKGNLSYILRLIFE